jgi:uncharacterized protein YijF (DUF1287 family)
MKKREAKFKVGDMVCWHMDEETVGLIVENRSSPGGNFIYRIFWYDTETTTCQEEDLLLPYNNRYAHAV